MNLSKVRCKETVHLQTDIVCRFEWFTNDLFCA
jgi:hypothetical protein